MGKRGEIIPIFSPVATAQNLLPLKHIPLSPTLINTLILYYK